MKKLLLMILLSFSVNSFADVSNFCITDVSGLRPKMASSIEVLSLNAYSDYGLCQSMGAVKKGLTVVSIGLGGASIFSACMVVTAPVTIGLAIASGVSQMISGSIDLACDTETPTPEQVQEYVCKQMKASGIPCDPKLRIHKI